MAWWSGWLATLAIVIAAAIPLGMRLRSGERPAPTSDAIRTHVVLGFALAFVHTLLVAHAGLRLKLRDEKLKQRVKTRRSHATTALAIAVAVAVAIHIVMLARSR